MKPRLAQWCVLVVLSVLASAAVCGGAWLIIKGIGL